MEAFDILSDPVRRRILELLAEEVRQAGSVTEVIRAEFGISQSAVSQHLGVLRAAGFATVEAQGARRLYALRTEALDPVSAWVDRLRGTLGPRLEALATEVERGKRARRGG